MDQAKRIHFDHHSQLHETFMITIAPLTGTDINSIHEAFYEAFSDYAEPFTLTVSELQHMIERRGFNPDLSFGAFDQGKLVGFILNGVDVYQGQKTAYDTGTGVIASYRQQGIASRILEQSLPVLKKNGITRYLLEVIKTNRKAADLYLKSGFKIVREFDYYVSETMSDFNPSKPLSSDCSIEKITNPDWQLFKRFWDFEPSWQNSIASINRKLEHFTVLGAYVNASLAGYGVIENATGDIPQLAIAHEHRRNGLASHLFSKLLEHNTAPRIKFINLEATSLPIKTFLESLGLSPGAGQYEMVLDF